MDFDTIMDSRGTSSILTSSVLSKPFMAMALIIRIEDDSPRDGYRLRETFPSTNPASHGFEGSFPSGHRAELRRDLDKKRGPDGHGNLHRT